MCMAEADWNAEMPGTKSLPGILTFSGFYGLQPADFTQLHIPDRETYKAVLILALLWELSHFSVEKNPFSLTFLEKQHPSGHGDSSFNKTTLFN